MLGLTSPTLLVLSIVAAVLAVIAVGVVVTAHPVDGSLGRRLALRTAPVVALALVGQACAVTAVALAVNNSYGFYTSWGDLLGGPAGNTPIRTGGLLAAGQGTVHVSTVHAHAAGIDDRVLVWTPRQYAAATAAGRPLPVVMFLPGQPSSPIGTFRHFDFGRIASRLIDAGTVPPFVAVFPTLMIAPPRDTECTDVPDGPQAESWLENDVPAYVTAHYRVLPPGPAWTVMGWSTGGFCAAKLLTAHPTQYSSAVSFGGYYQPLEDRTTGNLFAGVRQLELRNSPLWLYREDQRHGGLGRARLLMVAGRQDKETWPQTRVMINAARDDPAVARIAFPFGGHNYRNYRNYLAAALTWSASGWPR
jgi:S-formylglutathione hydrolase FrmB